MSATPRARHLALLGLLVAAIVAPFVDQAFHIDDEVYLRLADALAAGGPAGLLEGHAPLFGFDQPLWLHSQHPPLTVVALAAIRTVVGDGEIAVHAAYAGFTLLAAFAAYGFFARFTARPLLATALLIVSPAFVVSAHTVMTDVPFVGFVLLAVVAHLRLGDAPRARPAAIAWAALAGTACVFTQYRGVLVLGMLAVIAWRRRRLDLAAVIALAVPLIALAGYELAVAARIGRPPLAASAGFLEMGPGRLLLSSTTYLAGLGAALLALVPGALAAVPRGRALVLVVALALAGGLMWLQRREVAAHDAVLGVVLIAGGALVLGGPLRAAIGGAVALLRRDRPLDDGDLLAALALALFASVIAFGLFACMRNLLVVLPFAIAWLVRRPEILRDRPRAAAALGLTLALALACAISDRAWANGYRAIAAEVAAKPSTERELYFAGEWGFRYYMTQIGARYLERADLAALPAGTRVLVPMLAAYERAPNPTDNPRLIARGVYTPPPSPLPLRLMGPAPRNCGWYSEGWGVLPFCLARFDPDVVVEYVVDGAAPP